MSSAFTQALSELSNAANDPLKVAGALLHVLRVDSAQHVPAVHLGDVEAAVYRLAALPVIGNEMPVERQALLRGIAAYESAKWQAVLSG